MGTEAWRGVAGQRRAPRDILMGRPASCSPLCPQDGRLSKAEILNNWNMFVGSQATNYGDDLTRHHDEL